MKLLIILCLVLLSSCSQETEVVTGPFVFKNDITYDQNTNEPVTGIVESFHENGQLLERKNYKDGEYKGLWEFFDEEGNLTKTETYRNGERVE
jgi:antitoxin component YwqK of YwqJK toxin-antitoxin module